MAVNYLTKRSGPACVTIISVLETLAWRRKNKLTLSLITMAVLLGFGLAMDAFSVSLANGLADRDMSTGRAVTIAGTFALFQFAMPLIGWMFVEYAREKLEWFRSMIPWIAFLLLLYIGGKMFLEGIRENREAKTAKQADTDAEAGPENKLSNGELLLQGIATSIDALSVGFTTAGYSFSKTLPSSLIIGAVTFVVCILGLRIGRRLGTLLAGKASMLGGAILIAIGLEIWITGVFM